MTNRYWQAIRKGGNCLFSLFVVRPIRQDLEDRFTDKPFDKEKSLILDRMLQLEEMPYEQEEARNTERGSDEKQDSESLSK